MTNDYENEVLMNNDDIIEITLLNKSTGTVYPNVPVYGTNTFGQILDEYAKNIGIDAASQIIYENKRTGAQCNDSTAMVESLALQDGDVLSICDDGSVA